VTLASLGKTAPHPTCWPRWHGHEEIASSPDGRFETDLPHSVALPAAMTPRTPCIQNRSGQAVVVGVLLKPYTLSPTVARIRLLLALGLHLMHRSTACFARGSNGGEGGNACDGRPH